MCKQGDLWLQSFGSCQSQNKKSKYTFLFYSAFRIQVYMFHTSFLLFPTQWIVWREELILITFISPIDDRSRIYKERVVVMRLYVLHTYIIMAYSVAAKISSLPWNFHCLRKNWSPGGHRPQVQIKITFSGVMKFATFLTWVSS